MADLGAVVFVSWLRAATPAEDLHVIMSRLFGTTMPIDIMLERPIIVPLSRHHLARTGAQLNALQGWLQ
jgi:hypothetical protein